jgi:hypothetical protein
MSPTLLSLISESKDLIDEDIKGKYFQSKLDPLVIFCNPEFIEPNKANNFDWSVSVRIPFGEKTQNIPSHEAQFYMQISQESFEKMRRFYEKGLIRGIEKEYHKNLEKHKANLSA